MAPDQAEPKKPRTPIIESNQPPRDPMATPADPNTAPDTDTTHALSNLARDPLFPAYQELDGHGKAITFFNFNNPDPDGRTFDTQDIPNNTLVCAATIYNSDFQNLEKILGKYGIIAGGHSMDKQKTQIQWITDTENFKALLAELKAQNINLKITATPDNAEQNGQVLYIEGIGMLPIGQSFEITSREELASSHRQVAENLLESLSKISPDFASRTGEFNGEQIKQSTEQLLDRITTLCQELSTPTDRKADYTSSNITLAAVQEVIAGLIENMRLLITSQEDEQKAKGATDIIQLLTQLKPEILQANAHKIIDLNRQAKTLLQQENGKQNNKYLDNLATTIIQRTANSLSNPGLNASEIITTIKNNLEMITNECRQHPALVFHPDIQSANQSLLKALFQINAANSTTPPATIRPQSINAETIDIARRERPELPKTGTAYQLTVQIPGIAIQNFLPELETLFKLPLNRKLAHQIRYENGKLVIFGLNERSGAQLLEELAMEIYEKSGRLATIQLETCNLNETSSPFGNSFVAENNVEGGNFPELPGIYLHKSVYDHQKASLRNRMGSFGSISATPVERIIPFMITHGGFAGTPELYRLNHLNPEVKLAPQESYPVIGYENQRSTLRNAISWKTKLTIIAGPGGMGKTTLMELHRKDSATWHGFSETLKSRDGSTLVTIFTQLAEEFKNLQIPMSEVPEMENIATLSKPDLYKFVLTQQGRDFLKDICLKGWEVLKTETKKNMIVLDDLHYADTASLESLRQMIEEFSGQIFVGVRDDEMSQPLFLKRLKRDLGDKTTEVSVRDGLDFSDTSQGHESHAYQMIRSRLPEPLRNTPLGTWWQEFGKIAGNWPLGMTSLINGLLENPNNLIFKGGYWELSEEFKEKLPNIIMKQDDPRTFIERKFERLGLDENGESDNAGEEAKIILQALSMLGDTYSLEQISTLISRLSIMSPPEEILFRLIKSGFLKSTGRNTYKIHHDTYRQVINTGISPDASTSLAKVLYEIVHSDPQVPNETKLQLLIVQGGREPLNNKEFWENYLTSSREVLGELRDNNALEMMFQTGNNILDHLNPYSDSSVINALTDLFEGKIQNREAALLVVETLLALAECTLPAGRVKENEKIIQHLQAIAAKCPDLMPDLAARTRLLAFELAYQTDDKAQMDTLLQEIKNSDNLPEEKIAILEMKMVYMDNYFTEERDMSQPIAVFEKHRAKFFTLNQEYQQANNGFAHPDFVEAFRMLILCHSEQLNAKLRHQGVDDDAASYEASQSDDFQKDIRDIIELITNFDKLKKNISPIQKARYLDIKSKITAMSGNLENAVEEIGEARRIATQSGMHEMALNFCKDKGDLRVTQGLKIPGTSEYYFLQGLDAYYREGDMSDVEVTKPWTKFTIRCNRIANVGLLAANFLPRLGQGEIKPEAIIKKFGLYLKAAMEDIKFLSTQKDFAKYPNSDEIMYYMLLAQHVVQLGRGLFPETGPQSTDAIEEMSQNPKLRFLSETYGIPQPNDFSESTTDQYSFLNPDRLRAGHQWGLDNKEPDALGIRARRLATGQYLGIES